MRLRVCSRLLRVRVCELYVCVWPNKLFPAGGDGNAVNDTGHGVAQSEIKSFPVEQALDTPSNRIFVPREIESKPRTACLLFLSLTMSCLLNYTGT